MTETGDHMLEARVRVVLRSVAEATRVDAERPAAYVNTTNAPMSRRRRAPLLAALGAAAAVTAIVAVVGPTSSDKTSVRPADEGTVTSPPPPAPSPDGERLLDEGTVGGSRWALYGLDRLPEKGNGPLDVDESPCWKLVVDGSVQSPRGCGSDPRSPTGFRQLGPVDAVDDEVLVFGVLSPDVQRVLVQLGTTHAAQEARVVADPAHPNGARYVVVAVPKSDVVLSVRLLATGDRVLHAGRFPLDGPIGG